MKYSITQDVFNDSPKLLDLSPVICRLRSCDTKLTSATPANQYQKLKLIQNTVRVQSSLYTMNLGALSAYSNPTAKTYNVCWNQMSDRTIPSVQRATIPTGFNTTLNRRHTSVTSSRPGCQTPGGIGCDIKHNSYDRYLNRIKAKNPLRRGPVPSNFGNPIIFNRAYPIYGGKILKTNIVSGCDCPIEPPKITYKESIPLYYNPFYQAYPTAEFSFGVDQFVYAVKTGTTYYTKATIIKVNDNTTYDIEFEDGTIQYNVSSSNLKIYYPCNCSSSVLNETFKTLLLAEGGADIFGVSCLYPNYVTLKNSLT
jgi:hypothetical protein